MTRSLRLAFVVPFLAAGFLAGCGDSMKSEKSGSGMKKDEGMMKGDGMKNDGMMKGDGMKKDEGMMKGDGMKKDEGKK